MHKDVPVCFTVPMRQKSLIETVLKIFNYTAAQCSTEFVSMPVQSDLSRQRRLKQQNSKATRTRLCIPIRFVQLAINFSQIHLICPESNF